MVLLSTLLFGCKNNVAVESIYFNLEAGDSVSLLVGETFAPQISFNPTYPTNSKYELISDDETVLTVSGNKVTAKNEGSAILTVVSSDNNLIRDYVVVNVMEEQLVLNTPSVQYNPTQQLFVISTVENAVGYTLKINSEEINLGNINTYSLNDYANHIAGQTLPATDKVLSVSVKANAPKYTQAYASSGYSNEADCKIYQAGEVQNVVIKGGRLTFDTLPNLTYSVYLQGECINDNALGTVDLSNLSAEYSNFSNVQIGIKAFVNADVKTPGVIYHNSKMATLTPDVMAVANVNIVGTTLSWNNILGAEKYEIYFDGTLLTNTTLNSLNLADVANFDALTNNLASHNIVVKAVMLGSVENLVKTVKNSNDITLSRLQKPTLQAANNQISWNPVSNADCYEISINYEENSTPVKISTTTIGVNLDLSAENFPCGTNYNVEVVAMFTGESDGGVSYLSSQAGTVEVYKQSEVQAEISNYILHIKNAQAGEKYLVKYLEYGEIDPLATELPELKETTITLTAESADLQHSIATCNFAIGQNAIEIRHLGNNLEKFDSCTTSLQFTQLALPSSVIIQGGTARIAQDEGNELAEFHIKVINNDKMYEAIGTSYTFNSTDANAEHFLTAGTVEFLVFAVGDQSSTFTFRINGDIIPFHINDLKVLDIPTLTVKSADEPTLLFTESQGATNYKISGLAEQDITTAETSVNFEILEGQTKSVQIQALGNESNVFSSAVSAPISITKLSTPVMEYNNVTDVISKTDSNTTQIVRAYELKLNDELIDYDFTSKFTQFVVGENSFDLRALAINSTAETFYLNSNKFNLAVNKIDEQTTFTINSNNELIVTPKNQEQKYALQLTLKIGETEIEFESEDGALKSAQYELDYTFEDGAYIIPLLNAEFEPLIAELTEKFSVEVMYKATLSGQDEFANSSVSNVAEVQLAPKSTFNMQTRDGQFVIFNKLQATNSYVDFGLLVNNSYVLNLSSDVVVDETELTFKVDIDYIYSNVPPEELLDVNKLEIISFNTKSAENNPVLSVKNDVIYVALAPTFELTSSKNNIHDNKSQVISLAVEPLTYEVKYVVEVADETNVETLILTSANIANGTITFNLDDYTNELVQNITVQGKVHTTGTFAGEHDVFMFNSVSSNALNFVKLNEVANIDVNNGVLCFDAVENAVGYDIFKNVAGSLERVAFITGTTYNLAAETGDINVQIRAISAEEQQTNSNLCQEVLISKLATPLLSIEAGQIVLELSSEAMALLEATTFEGEETFETSDGAMIYYANDINSGYLALTSEGVCTSANKVIIDTVVVLNYGVGELLKENLTFAIKVNKSSAGKFINSNDAMFGVYGLFAPTAISKTSNFEGESEVVENITWVSSTKNILDKTDLTSGYIVKVQTETKTYLSSDAKLKYLDKLTDGVLAYSSVITANSIPFPYGYDDNNNGTIEENEKFGVGTYLISVQTLPKVISGWNLASSKFSDVYTLTLLATPELSSNDGTIIWGENKDATSYLVKVYDQQGEYVDTENTTSNKFDFSSAAFDSYKGIYQIEVQAISNKTNVVKSAVSKRMFVYRMPEAESLIVDDGNLVLFANKYFTSAVLDFVDTESTKVQTLIYSRAEEAAQVVNNLDIDSFGNFAGNVNNLFESERFVISISNSEILELMLGRSYTINVRLIGNGGVNQVVVNSKTTPAIRTTTTTKLNATLMEVEAGILTFSTQTEYKSLNLNYNFNNQEIAGGHKFFTKTAIYAISFTANGSKHNFYAVDYNDFTAAVQDGTLTAGVDYEMLTSTGDLVAFVKYAYPGSEATEYLYLSVYNNNSFNLRDSEFLYYYPINKTYIYNELVGVTTGETIKDITLSSLAEYQPINIGDGGSFVVEVCMLGGDEIVEATTSAYLSSNFKTSNTFIRYGANVLSSSEGKLLLQNFLAKNEQGQVVDTPVYELTVKSATTGEISKVYLYHSTEEEARIIINDANAEYVKVEIQYREVQEEPEIEPLNETENPPIMEETGYLLFDFSEYFPEGTYIVNIRTLAGMGVGIDAENYLLDAKVPTHDYVYKKISSTNIVANDGVLEFGLGYIVNDTSNSYIYNYEVTIIDQEGTEYVHIINGASRGVTIDEENHKIKYILPNEINCGKQTLTVENSKEYSIKVKGMAVDNYIINASYPEESGQDKCLTFAISGGVETIGQNAVAIKNGRLEWKVKDLNYYQGVVILLTYLDANGEVRTIRIETSGEKLDVDGNYVCHYYNFGDAAYKIQGTDSYADIDAGTDYELSMFVKGTSSAETAILNSTVTASIDANRVGKVDVEGIMSRNGNLVWRAVDGAAKYSVILFGATQHEFIVESTELDFFETLDVNETRLPAGEYSIKIRAIGNTAISSTISSTAEGFKRLPLVTGLGVNKTDSNYISWQPVAGAQAYKVVFEFGYNAQEETYSSKETLTINDGITRCSSPLGLFGKYMVSVSAIGLGEGKVFNGDATTFTSSKAVPQPVGNVTYDEKTFRYSFPVAADDFTEGDKIRITYNFYPYVIKNGEAILSEESTIKTVHITYLQQGSYFIGESGEVNYVFAPIEMGKYENFTVQVEREGTLLSAGSEAEDRHFNLFASGMGTAENPYGIINSTNLLNIKHKSNAFFKLYSAVNLADINIEKSLTNNGYLIADEFTGQLDGSGYKLLGLEGNRINLLAARNFALFGNLNGAVIKNLVIGNEENSINVTNTFASNNKNVVKLSLIATNATNSTFEDVSISGIRFVVDGAGVLSGAVYIAGFAVTATNSTFAGCVANVDIQFNADFSSSSTCVAGMVAEGHQIGIQSNISGRASEAKFSLTQQKTNRMFGYVGGMVGYLTGVFGNENHGIDGAKVETNITSNVYATNLGGIVGFASNSQIKNCTIKGKYIHTALTGEQNIGGVVGTAQSVSINGCKVELTFQVDVDNSTDIKIGAVAGYLTSVNNGLCSVTNCKIAYEFETETRFGLNGIDAIGIYGGSATTNVTVSGCEKL